MDDWRIGFHRALVDAIVHNGSPHDPTRSAYYGSSLPDNWVDVSSHVAAAGIDYANTPAPTDATWLQFGGTFNEDTYVHGVDIELFLNDGTRQWYRYSGTISDLILAIVKDPSCEGSGRRWDTEPGNRVCPVCRTTRRSMSAPWGTSAYLVPEHRAKST